MANKSMGERVEDYELIEAFNNAGTTYQDIIKYIHDNFDKTISRTTIYFKIKQSAKLKAAFKDNREREIDYAESKLKTAIKNDNLSAIIFFLKTIGKNRGYTEKQQIEAAAEIRAVNPYDQFTREELREMLKDDLPK